MKEEVSIEIIDKDTLSKFYFIKRIMGLVLLMITYLISYFHTLSTDFTSNLLFYNLIAFTSGILFYIIVIIFLRYSFKSAYFQPETIPNYLLQVAFIVVGFSTITGSRFRIFTIFMSTSGLYFMSFSFLAISHFDKNQFKSCQIIKRSEFIIFEQKVNYPILGIGNLLKISIRKQYSLNEKLPIAILKLETKEIRFPLKIIRNFKFLTEEEIMIASDETAKYVLYGMTEKDRSGSPRGIVIQNNLTHLHLQSLLMKIKGIISYDVLKIANGMKLEVNFLNIKFKPI